MVCRLLVSTIHHLQIYLIYHLLYIYTYIHSTDYIDHVRILMSEAYFIESSTNGGPSHEVLCQPAGVVQAHDLAASSDCGAERAFSQTPGRIQKVDPPILGSNTPMV